VTSSRACQALLAARRAAVAGVDELGVGRVAERPGDEVDDRELGLRVARRHVDDQPRALAAEHAHQRIADDAGGAGRAASDSPCGAGTSSGRSGQAPFRMPDSVPPDDADELLDVMTANLELRRSPFRESRLPGEGLFLSAVVELMFDHGAELGVRRHVGEVGIQRNHEIRDSPEPLPQLLLLPPALPSGATEHGHFGGSGDAQSLLDIDVVRPQDADRRLLEVLMLRIVERAFLVQERFLDPRPNLRRRDVSAAQRPFNYGIGRDRAVESALLLYRESFRCH
jgi:hypothetical protein